MKKKLLIIVFLFGTLLSHAQDIKLKKGIVYCDDKEILTYTSEIFGVFQYHFFTLDTKEEILFIKKNDNGTTKFEDDFTQIKFLKFGKMAETKQDKPWKKYILWLIQNKVLDTNGILNEEKIDLFIKNYDENITNRTVIVNR
jgi:hypothetical protein